MYSNVLVCVCMFFNGFLMCLYVFVCVLYVSMCLYVFVCVCMCLCVFVYLLCIFLFMFKIRLMFMFSQYNYGVFDPSIEYVSNDNLSTFLPSLLRIFSAVVCITLYVVYIFVFFNSLYDFSILF